jgi:hypothetical protein
VSKFDQNQVNFSLETSHDKGEGWPMGITALFPYPVRGLPLSPESGPTVASDDRLTLSGFSLRISLLPILIGPRVLPGQDPTLLAYFCTR